MLTSYRIVVGAALMLTLVVPPPAAQEPMLPAEVCDTLKVERAKYPDPIQTHEQLGNVLIATAWKHRADGWGLSRKDFGQHNPHTAAGPIADDILHRKGDNRIWDVMVAAGVGFPSTITCSEALGVQTDGRRPWVAPVDVTGGTTPPPPSCDDCLAGLKVANGEIARLRDEINVRDNRIGLLENELDAERGRRLEAERQRDEATAAVDPLNARIRELESRRCSFDWGKFACRIK